MALRDQAISRGASILIFDPNEITEVKEFNTRDMKSPETVAYIRSMADIIKADGNEMFPPITITQTEEGKIAVMAGWCRRRAHILAMKEGAPIKGIQCIAVTKKSKEEITLDILTSNSGLPLSAIEKANAVARLQKFSWSPQDIATKTGWSISTINNLIALHEAPDEVARMVACGEVSATLATEIVKSNTPAEAVKKLRSAVDTAEKSGKKKATKRDMKEAAKKGIPWKQFGPQMYKLLDDIYECPVSNRAKLQESIAAAGELLADLEERYPALKGE